MTKPLNLATLVIAVLFFFLPPLLWLSLFADPSDWPKNILLLAVTILAITLWIIQTLAAKSVSLTKTPFTIPIFLLVLASLISLWFSPNRVESAILPLGTATIVSLSLIFFFLTGPLFPQSLSSRFNFPRISLISLIASVLLSGFITLASFFLPLSAKPLFLAGNIFSVISILITISVGAASFLWFTLKPQEPQKPLFFILPALLLLLPLLLLVGILLKSRPLSVSLAFLPYTAGWQVAAEALKNTPLWGYGPTNFLSGFTAGRPISLNTSPVLWNYRFFVSSNTPLHLLTTAGLIGLSAYILIIISIIRSVARNFDRLSPLGRTITMTMTITILLQFLLPPTIITWWLFSAVLILYVFELRTLKGTGVDDFTLSLATKDVRATDITGPTDIFSSPRINQYLPQIVATVIIIILIPALYFSGRVIAADLTYKNALDAISGNLGTPAYNLLISAINLNPYMEAYHLTYSQLNLALANSIAGKGDLTETDRNTISQLIQQAIREGKAAIALNPGKVTNWENLAVLYRNLINFAQGADQWAIAASTQSVALSPTDPNLRLSLGRLYFSLADYDNAVLFFNQAAALKPDWPNAHYNLAAALKEKKNLSSAVTELQTTLSLLPSNSADAAQLKNELDSLEKAIAATSSATVSPTGGPTPTNKTTTGSAGLSAPTPIPSPIIKPPLELGNESAPPASPTPEPTNTPTVTSEPSPTPAP